MIDILHVTPIVRIAILQPKHAGSDIRWNVLDVVNDNSSFSPDGARVVTAGFDHTARLWKAETGEPIATLTGHNDRVIAAAFNQDGSRVVTASADRTARLWDGYSGAPIATLAGHSDSANLGAIRLRTQLECVLITSI